MIGFTHLLFALALSTIFGSSIIMISIGSVLPDIDLILQNFGFVHRFSSFHTPLLLSLFSIVIFIFTNLNNSISFSIGWLSHLLLDTTTKIGVHWLFPLKYNFTLNLFASDDFFGNFLIIVFSILVLTLGKVKKWRFRTKTF